MIVIKVVTLKLLLGLGFCSKSWGRLVKLKLELSCSFRHAQKLLNNQYYTIGVEMMVKKFINLKLFLFKSWGRFVKQKLELSYSFRRDQ
jgi:hypothetical protein